MENKMHSKERRDFIKYGLGLAGLAVAGIANADRLTKIIGDWGKKENEKIDRESYMKLRKMVCSEKTIEMIPNRGWEFYAQGKLNKNPWLEEYANVIRLGKFYKIFNGGGEPSLIVGKIREPLFKNPKTKICK